MAAKHRKMVTHRDRFPPINSQNPLNMSSHEVKWQIKNIVSPTSQCLWSQDLSEWWLTQGAPTHKFLCPLNEVVMWGHVTNKIRISTYRRPKNTKLGKVLFYSERLQCTFDHAINIKSHGNFKNLYFHYHKSYGQ